MDRLWSWDRPTTVREVVDDLQRSRQIAYTTVMTVMDNLHSKGVLTRVRDGRAYRYEPVRSREEHTAALLSAVLDVGGDRGAALLHFVGQMTVEDVAALREALRRHGRGGRGR
jgi:predicted transcriptional regulator